MMSNETKWTPGPWRYVARNVNELMTTFHGVTAGNAYIEVATGNNWHDAHLIAAAPELYSLLEQYVEAFECKTRGCNLEEVARKTLTKARGES